MAQKLINIGLQPNDGSGDSIRDAFQTINTNFSELYIGIPPADLTSINTRLSELVISLTAYLSSAIQASTSTINTEILELQTDAQFLTTKVNDNYNKLIAKILSVSVSTDLTALQAALAALVKVVDSKAGSSDVQSDVTTNSLEVPATSMSIASVLGDTIKLDNIAYGANYAVGQQLRIFGANLNNEIIAIPRATTVRKNGFILTTGASVFSYRVAQYEYSTGKISRASSTAVDTKLLGIEPTAFNVNNNIAVTVNRTDLNYGILIYRKITGETNYSLISVLGPKELGTSVSSVYIDFYDTDYVSWSGKSVAGNYFTTSSKIVHFPVTAPNTEQYGWVDVSVKAVDAVNGKIQVAGFYYFNSTLVISHNDTAFIQSAITQRSARGLYSLELGAKTYITSGLIIPAQFSIYGKGKRTLLKKLSWSSKSSDTNRMFKTVENLPVNGVSIANLRIDGNMQNQYLVGDATDLYANYVIDIRGDDNEIENVSVTNCIGGGISADNSANFSVNVCRVDNSCLTDRIPYSPLLASGSSNVIVTNNIMKNFPGSIDLTVCRTGVLTGNIISNCGSGVIIYGSTNFVSSPNVLMGPAGEFIPGPDILNSEYDSINIKLEPGSDYTSTQYVYQENGIVFNLSLDNAANHATAIAFSVDQLQSVDNVESLYGPEVLVNGLRPIVAVGGTNLASGNFQFKISRANVNELTRGAYSFENLRASNAAAQGLVYRAIVTEYAPCGTISAPAILSASDTASTYRVTVANASNIGIGSIVYLKGHGGTPDLGYITGTVTAINNNMYTITYGTRITSLGGTGTINVENSFILAKGRIL